MKTYLVLIAALVGSALAQKKYQIPDKPLRAAEPLTAPMPHYGSTSVSQQGKTNASEIDTVNAHWERCSENQFVFSFNRDEKGYLNGTRDSTTTNNGNRVYVSEHGNSMEFEQRPSLQTQITSVFAYFTDVSKFTGSADSLEVSVLSYPVGGSVSYVGGERFWLGDLVNDLTWIPMFGDPYRFENKIVLKNPINVGVGRHIVLISVNEPMSDDTVSMYFTRTDQLCDPQGLNDWFIGIRDGDWGNNVNIQTWNSFYLPANDPNMADVVGIMPVVQFFDPTAVHIPLEDKGIQVEKLINDPASKTIGLDLHTDRTVPIKFTIRTLQGKVVAQQDHLHKPGSLLEYRQSTADWAAGMYILTAESSNALFTKKLLVQ